jgi:hypothetical protein
MTDPINPEGGAEQVNPELPTPKFTDASPGSATSSMDPEALTEAILKRLDPILEKKMQSTKDKRIANIEKRLGIQDLEELKAMGATIPDNVLTEYRFRQLEESRQSAPSSQAPTSQGSGATLTATDVSEVVKNYQLDANTPEVLDALRGTYRNRDHFEATMAKLALKRTTIPQPSAAEAASLQTPAASAAGVKDLQSAYEKKRNEIAQTLRGDAKVKALSDLKVDYRGRGLNI